MRMGFVCNWESPRPRTWSHIPSSLLGALGDHAEVQDLGVDLPPWLRTGLKAAHARRVDGRWTSRWKWSPALAALVRREASRGARAQDCDAVLQIHDLTPLPVRNYVFQDLSIDVLLEAAGTPMERFLGFDNMGVDAGVLRRRRRHQMRVYAQADGVIAMSRWFAQHLVEVTGLDPEQVHAVHPGCNAVGPQTGQLPSRWDRDRHRLLFVGRDFTRKGGPEVVHALQILREGPLPGVRLTVCGPRSWPMPGYPPPGVDFLGDVPPARLRAVFAEHDLFVMPSHFEAFGIAFVEALAQGLPCVARRRWAMPEIIEDGVDGALVDDGTPDELATAIHDALSADGLYRAVAQRADIRAAHFSWDRAAAEIVQIAA